VGSSNGTVSIVPLSSSIKIKAAVFADGTYEGDPEPACSFEGYQKGRKLWLEKALVVLDSQFGETTTDGPAAAAALKEKLSLLRYPRGTSEVSKSCNSVSAVEAAFNGQKLQLLRELDTIITSRPAPPINFKGWLQTAAERYRAWLARI
jgi:hypothetical protein